MERSRTVKRKLFCAAVGWLSGIAFCALAPFQYVIIAAAGIFFPAIWKKQRRFRVFALTAAAVIICVELLQFLTMRGSCDIDDFILNFFGAVIGFSLTSIKIVRKLTFVGKE